MRSWNSLVHERATCDHGLTRFTTTQTWGEASTFPLIVYFMPGHGTSTKCHFVLGLPSGNPKIPTTRISAILGAHNFVCKPSIEMKSEAKL